MQELIKVLNNTGLIIDNPILDKSFHKCLTISGKKSKSGWYNGFIDNDFIFCSYGDFRTGLKAKYSNKSESDNTEYNIDIQAIIKASEEKEKRKHQKSADISRKVIENSEPLNSHEYLIKKQTLTCKGLLENNDKIICPIYDTNTRQITGYQSIDRAGNKLFPYGIKKKGSCFPILGNNTEKTDLICVCEGLATGLSIFHATGFTVFVAFDAYNLMPVCESLVNKKYSNILICADNDHVKKDGSSPRKDNPGIENAKEISLKHNISYVYPKDIQGTDFNDLQIEKGVNELRKIVIKGYIIEPYQRSNSLEKFQSEISWCIENAPGLLKDISDYYNKTAVKPQPIFALASGIILGSVLFGRRYNTGDYDNFTSLYSLIIAKSGTGKDHIKQVIRTILTDSGLEWLERGDGFTAANTIIKSLNKQALQLTFFEEIGQRLTESSIKNNSAQKGMFRKLLDIWSSCHSFVVGEEYADQDIPRAENPALTLCGISTPRAFTDSINDSLIEQGFINRLLPFISFQERVPTPLQKKRTKPPKKIIDWIQNHWLMGNLASAGMPIIPNKEHEIIIDFSDNSLKFFEEIEHELVASANILEKRNLDDLLSRVREMSMRVALITAVFDNSPEIKLQHCQWAYRLVNSLYGIYIDMIKKQVSGSDYEKWKLEALQYLRGISPDGLRPRDMPSIKPFSKWNKRDRDEILNDLEKAELIAFEQIKTGKRGKPKKAWIAIN